MSVRSRWIDVAWALFTNLFVLSGVIAWGWPPGNVFVLFWIENVILGAVTAVRILTAEGAQQAAILTAEGERQAQILLAQGQGQAIGTVFEAIHAGRPDPELLAYQYLQTLPKIASGDGNHTWLIPSELTRALDAFASGFGDRQAREEATPSPSLPAPGQLIPKTPAPAPPTNGQELSPR